MSEGVKMEIDKPKTVEAPQESQNGEQTCPKYESLINCVEKFIQKIRGKPGSCKKLSKAFPTLYKSHPEVVSVASDHLWNTFEENLRAHIMELIKNMKLKILLYELSQCETSDDGPAWRPTGNPEKDSEAHVALSQHASILELTNLLQKEQSKNTVLQDQLQIKEARIKALLTEVEERLEKIEEASSLCERVEACLQRISNNLDEE